LPLLGVSVSENPRYFRIVSEWMPNGNVVEYIKSNPEANRLCLVSLPCIHCEVLGLRLSTIDPQLSEVASGVAYLHGLGIAHGDLKGVCYHVLHSLATPLTVLVG